MQSEAISLPVIVMKPRWETVLPFTGSVIVAGIGGYALADGRSSWFVWMVLVLFCGSGLYYLGQYTHSRPRLVISREGICADHWNSDLMPWADFIGASLKTANEVHWLCLELRDPEEFRRTISSIRRTIHTANQKAGLGDLAVELSGTGLDAAEVVALVRQQIELAKTKPKQPGSSFRYPSVK